MNDYQNQVQQIMNLAKHQMQTNPITREQAKQMLSSINQSDIEKYLGKGAKIDENSLNSVFKFLGI